ncbi:citryl-CoA lyase [Mycobacterium sp.]|uniref:citryl-CoA lyase n=1 Tax=Mycobacterium sp. TaxID=1785 RepID=UPI00260FF839|nr:citryl-CoA lyase [Mycobacterium sp.]
MSDEQVADWWGTAVSRIEPNRIELRGHPVQELIGTTGFGSMIWLMVRGDLPTPAQVRLLEAALVAGVDHGPHAPSIAIARMTATCGVGLNNAMASAVNSLGDSHGGAGEQCVELLSEVHTAGVEATITRWRERGIRYLPGFGHRFHNREPRRDPLLGLVDEAVADGVVEGHYLRAALGVEAAISPVPMNIDGATAVVYAELGFAAPLARGLFVLSRSVGILAHAWEEIGQGRRNKGPMPPSILPTFLDRFTSGGAP